MAHGGSGDVRAEWFEGIFDKSLDKYEGVKGEMAREEEKQKALLERIRVSFPLTPFGQRVRADVYSCKTRHS
jgi:hypothetical protein